MGLENNTFTINKTYSIDSGYLPAQPPPPRRRPTGGIEPITSDAWNALSEKAKWDSIVALRGPDLKSSDTLKYFTASVIRWRLSGVMRVGGMINRYLGCVVIPAAPKSSSQFDASHFIGHVHEAADWLGVPIVYCGEAAWKLMLDAAPHSEVIAALLDDPSISDDAKKLIARGGRF